MGEAEERATHEELSQRIKKEAERQRVRIEVTEEQLQGLLGQWDDGDPKAPAQITFLVQDREVASLAVAGYRYRGDTCCV
jgi:hypothetical protein